MRLKDLFFKPRPLPAVQIICVFNHHDSVVTPYPIVKGTVLNAAGDHVVDITYGLSPIHDCLYVYDIKARLGFHGRGYALAAVNTLWHRFRLPVRPVHIIMTGERFWTPTRFRRYGIEIAEELPSAEVSNEKRRWAHLSPWSEKLSKHILRRLCEEYLPYDEAVSVGIDFPNRKMTEKDSTIQCTEFSRVR
jgi:hypothetical protein